MNKKAKLTESKTYWKARGENGQTRNIPLNEMDDDHLQRAFFVTQNKELEYTNESIKYADASEKSANKSVKFADLGNAIQSEAESRGLTLRSIENEPQHKIKDFFANNRKFKP